MTETPDCLATTYLWFSGAWLALCYYWVIVHGALGMWAWRLRRRVHRTEANQLDIEDDEMLRRWGRVRSDGNRTLVDAAGTGAHLSSALIKTLPCQVVSGSESTLGNCECPICLTDMEPGDTIRCLPNCDHTFHRSCIDLWLVRSTDCPLCKRHVMADRGK